MDSGTDLFFHEFTVVLSRFISFVLRTITYNAITITITAMPAPVAIIIILCISGDESAPNCANIAVSRNSIDISACANFMIFDADITGLPSFLYFIRSRIAEMVI